MFIIATNSEKYIGFQIGQVRFIDSMQLLNSSLDSLISTVAKDGLDKFIYTKRHFPDMGQFELVTRKGVFPYEWFDSAERFEEIFSPCRTCFIVVCTKRSFPSTTMRTRSLFGNILIFHLCVSTMICT